MRGNQKIGTTGRGIGPAYEDKVARRAVRVADLYNEPVYIDKKDRFSIPIALTPGKNLVKTKVITTSDDEIIYSMRILSLKTFPDLSFITSCHFCSWLQFADMV